MQKIKKESQTDQVKKVFRKNGIKCTPQRLEVYREVIGNQSHPCAETIFRAVRKKIPTISLDTVYRTLWTLKDLGIICELEGHSRSSRFEGNLEKHHHFFCEKCGSFIDIHSNEFNSLKVPESSSNIGIVRNIQIELIGTCLECLQKTESENRSETE